MARRGGQAQVERAKQASNHRNSHKTLGWLLSKCLTVTKWLRHRGLYQITSEMRAPGTEEARQRESCYQKRLGRGVGGGPLNL